jgi:hypothetical protein
VVSQTKIEYIKNSIYFALLVHRQEYRNELMYPPSLFQIIYLFLLAEYQKDKTEVGYIIQPSNQP